MIKYFTGSIAGLLLGASAAQAATFLTSLAGAPDPGAVGKLLFDFDSPILAGQLGNGITITGDYHVHAGDAPPNAAAPAGDATPYLAVPGTGYSGFATIDFTDATHSSGIGGFNFYWGSIDAGNRLAVVTSAGTDIFTGADIVGSGFGSTSSAQANRRVFFGLANGESLYELRLYSDLPAFELDDFAVIPTVPEPAAWAMMIIGILSIGIALRRSRPEVSRRANRAKSAS